MYILAKKLRSDRQIKFAVVLIDYVLKTWINHNNNNHAEGYNNRLGQRKTLGKHPNFYQFVAAIKQELGILHDAAMAAEAGKPNKKPRDKKNIRNLI